MKQFGKILCLGLFSLALFSCGGKDEPTKDPVVPGGGNGSGQGGQGGGSAQVEPFTGDQDKGAATPLTYVSRYALNGSGKAFVKTHAIKFNEKKKDYEKEYAKYTSSDVGYFTNNEARTMFAQPVKIDGETWHIPSKKEWEAILYGDYFDPNVRFSVVSLSGNAKEVTKLKVVNETVTVQGENFSYKADYIARLKEGVKPESSGAGKRFVYVTYAHRFKGTKWNSAWRYSFDKARSGVKVECVALKGNTGIDDIQSAKFFTDNPSTVRFFPLYGALPTEKSTRIDKLGVDADYLYLEKGSFVSGIACWSVDQAGIIQPGGGYKNVIRPFK